MFVLVKIVKGSPRLFKKLLNLEAQHNFGGSAGIKLKSNKETRKDIQRREISFTNEKVEGEKIYFLY